MILLAFLPWIILVWYIVVITLGLVGFVQIVRWFGFRSAYLNGTTLNTEALPCVTILRPIRGLDPGLEECLESSFLQSYPAAKVEILFCIASENDPALPVVERLRARYPAFDCRILVDRMPNQAGLNPKINNLVKGYVSAKHDLLWVCDSNVWAGPGALTKSVNAFGVNGGYERGRKIKVVHHVPLAVAVNRAHPLRVFDMGSKLDEMFMTTAHAKYYMGLNTVNTAPCVNGKSNLYRRSELDESVRAMTLDQKETGAPLAPVSPYTEAYLATSSSVDRSRSPSALLSSDTLSDVWQGSALTRSVRVHPGLLYFGQYIGEDNMIAIALWNYPPTKPGYSKLIHEAVFQPVNHAHFNSAHMASVSPLLESLGTIKNYVDRRTRWLRVRKYMVLAATLLEPSTECLFAGLLGSYAVSRLFLPGAQLRLLLLHTIVWFGIDVAQWRVIRQAYRMYGTEGRTIPTFLPASLAPLSLRDSAIWVLVWIVREVLAFPVWLIAMFGDDVNWRGQEFVITQHEGARRTHSP